MRLADLLRSLLRRPGAGRPDAAGPMLSRRDLAGGAAGGAAGLLLPGAALGAQAPAGLAAMSRVQLSVLLRGLADLEVRNDPALDHEVDELLGQIAAIMPEAPLLMELHRCFGPSDDDPRRPPARIDLAALHRACHEARPVSFGYTDLRGNATSRRVLPLELVHPPHGILLLAWCELRGAQRKFFVHAMDGLQVLDGDFSDRRMALLEEAVEEALAYYG